MKRLLIVGILTAVGIGCVSSPVNREPIYKAGEWIQSKAGKKCGIIHAITNMSFRNPPIDYEIRVPSENRYDGYWTNFISEEEAERCEPLTAEK